MNETIEATGVELEPLSDRTLVGIRDPLEAIDEVKRIAGRLNAELKAGDMVTKIGGREHVLLEGWQTLATMLGIVSVIAWTKPLENGWEARAEARTLDGRTVGGAEAMCTRAERNWARNDDFAIRSMAQTRAQSKALRGPLGFVMTLAGHETTPAEEVDETSATESAAPALPTWAQPASVKQTADVLRTLLEGAGVEEPATRAREIGQRIFDQCEQTVPLCVLAALVDMRDTVAAVQK